MMETTGITVSEFGTVDAADRDIYMNVRVRLTGSHTPLRRSRQLVQPSLPKGGSEGNSGDSDVLADATFTERWQSVGGEQEMRILLDDATMRAERMHGDCLCESSTWRSVVDLLPLLAQAQQLLLSAETTRCRQLEKRRGRVINVRFVCYDLSAIDPRPADTSRADDHKLLAVLADLVGMQRVLVQTSAPDALAAALDAIASALNDVASDTHVPRSRQAAAWCAAAFGKFRREGTPLLSARFSELLGSLMRFHLHQIFDRPSRAQARRVAHPPPATHHPPACAACRCHAPSPARRCRGSRPPAPPPPRAHAHGYLAAACTAARASARGEGPPPSRRGGHC